MKHTRIKTLLSVTMLAAVALGSAEAQTSVTTDPVGFNSVTCLPQSDTFCSVPFNSETPFQSTLAGVPTEASGQATITPTATAPGWTVNQFAGLYYVRITSGAKAGMYYQILSNTAGTLNIDLAGDTVATTIAGDSFRVCKFWTLATLLPVATQTTAVVSASTLPAARRTLILLPDVIGAGINLAPTQSYFLLAAGWKKNVTGFPAADDTILLPDSYFIVRHSSSAIVASTTYTPVGGVETTSISSVLSAQVSGGQDNPITHGRPVPVKLLDLDLISTGAFVASATTLPAARRDQLLVFDNTIASLNKAPSATYFYSGGNWRKAVTGFPVADNDEIPPSSGFIIRKYQSATASVVWKNDL